MFKLINENGILHDFHSGSFWGHSVQETKNMGVVEFCDGQMNTEKYRFEVFHPIPMYPGDFITRPSERGRIMLFEVKSCNTKAKESGNRHWPPDYYVVNTVWCGYYDENSRQRIIHKGYGVENSVTNKVKEIPMFRSLLLLASVLLLIAIYVTLIK